MSLKFKTASQSSSYGFTLVELLIAVAIIALLTSIGITAFTRAQRNSRDVRRRADLMSLSSALELYYDDNNAYPSEATWASQVPGDGNALDSGLVPTYIKVLPDDPMEDASDGYAYFYNSSVGCYCLSAQMEIAGNADFTQCTNAGWTGGPSSQTNLYGIACP